MRNQTCYCCFALILFMPFTWKPRPRRRRRLPAWRVPFQAWTFDRRSPGCRTKTSGCKLRRGISGIAMQDPDCTPGAINQSVTIDVIRNEKFHAACVNSCLTSDSERRRSIPATRGARPGHL